MIFRSPFFLLFFNRKIVSNQNEGEFEFLFLNQLFSVNKYFVLKFFEKLGLLLVFILAFVFGIRLIHEPDIWWMLRTGEFIVQNGIPETDPFSFTHYGVNWLNVKWLFEVLVYFVANSLGEGYITLLQALVNCIMIFFLWKISRLFNINVWVFLIFAVLALFGLEYRMLNRPEMVSHTMVTIFLYLWLKNYQQPGKFLFFIIPLQALWANLHEAYAIGVVVSASFVVGQFLSSEKQNLTEKLKAIQTPLVIAILSGLAVIIHPYHLKMLWHPFEIFSQLGENKFTTELFGISSNYYWSKKEVYFTLFFLTLALLLALFFRFKKAKIIQPIGLGYFILLCLFLYLATTAHRNIVFLILTIFPLLGYLTNLGLQKFKRIIIPFSALSLMLLFGGYFAVASNYYYRETKSANDFGIGVSKWNNPVQVAKFLEDNQIKGKAFSDYLISSYLMWHLKDDFKTYIDFRDLDIFPADFFYKFIRITEFPTLFIDENNQQHFDYVVLYRNQFFNLHKFLYHSPDWRLVYADMVGCIYVNSTKYPSLPEGNFYSQEPQVIQSKTQQNFTKLLWPIKSFGFEPYNDALIGARFFKRISAYGLAKIKIDEAKQNSDFNLEATIEEGNIYLAMADEAQTAEEQIRILDKAINIYQGVLGKQKFNPDALFGLGFSLYKKGDFVNSQSVLKQVIKHSPTYFDAYSVLANLQNIFMQKDPTNSAGYEKKWFEYMLKAYEINPTDEVTMFKLGVSYCQRGKCSEAQPFLKPLSRLPVLTDQENKLLLDCKNQCL